MVVRPEFDNFPAARAVEAARRKDPERDLKRAQERTFKCHRRTATAAGAAPGVAGQNPVPILRI